MCRGRTASQPLRRQTDHVIVDGPSSKPNSCRNMRFGSFEDEANQKSSVAALRLASESIVGALKGVSHLMTAMTLAKAKHLAYVFGLVSSPERYHSPFAAAS